MDLVLRLLEIISDSEESSEGTASNIYIRERHLLQSLLPKFRGLVFGRRRWCDAHQGPAEHQGPSVSVSQTLS